jgi:hypothetical protein
MKIGQITNRRSKPVGQRRRREVYLPLPKRDRQRLNQEHLSGVADDQRSRDKARAGGFGMEAGNRRRRFAPPASGGSRRLATAARGGGAHGSHAAGRPTPCGRFQRRKREEMGRWRSDASDKRKGVRRGNPWRRSSPTAGDCRWGLCSREKKERIRT